MHRTDASAKGTSRPQVRYAGPVDTAYPGSPALNEQLRTTPYLTTIDQTFTDPQHQVVSDLTFEKASSDARYRRIRWEDRYRIPVDVAIIGILLIAAPAIVILWRIRTRARSIP